MLEYAKGDLFAADVDTLVNPVNTVGVMGRGLALQFSRRFPEIVQSYRDACQSGALTVGTVQAIRLARPAGASCLLRHVVNFPTKRHWKESSRLEWIEAGLLALRAEIVARDIASVAVPQLGCGLGGLSWPDVRFLIAEHLGGLGEVRVLVFGPADDLTADADREQQERMLRVSLLARKDQP